MSQNVKHNKQEDLSQETSRAVASLHADVDHYVFIDKIRKIAMPGEILEFQRGAYTDFALYLGDGKVMTFGLTNKRSTEGKFQEVNLLELSDNGKARLRNQEDVAQALFNLSPKEPPVIVKTAREYLNNAVPYEYDFRNSEYYCTLWRYGLGFSTQVAQQAWLPAESTETADRSDVRPRSNLFGPYGYAKYKTVAATERSAGLC